MSHRFKLEVEVVLDADSEAGAIELARQCYGRGPGSMVDSRQGQLSARPPGGFIEGIDDALIELLERNPLLSQAGAQVERISCASVNVEPDPEQQGVSALDSDEQLADEEGLDEFESGLYLCRWPNGEFSVVKADTKREAILELDEWAGAEPAWLVPMETCMIDFRLNDRSEIELTELGEETDAFIWDVCYPELETLLSSEDVLRHRSGNLNPKVARKIRRAVERERTRLWNCQPYGVPAKTALGRELQKRLGTVGPVADHYVQQLGNKIMRGRAAEKGKPN
jgi:hypothetical protein